MRFSFVHGVGILQLIAVVHSDYSRLLAFHRRTKLVESINDRFHCKQKLFTYHSHSVRTNQKRQSIDLDLWKFRISFVVAKATVSADRQWTCKHLLWSDFLLAEREMRRSVSVVFEIDVALYKSDKSQHKRLTSHPDFSFIPRTKANLTTSFYSTNNSRPADAKSRKSSLNNSISDGRSTTCRS